MSTRASCSSDKKGADDPPEQSVRYCKKDKKCSRLEWRNRLHQPAVSDLEFRFSQRLHIPVCLKKFKRQRFRDVGPLLWSILPSKHHTLPTTRTTNRVHLPEEEVHEHIFATWTSADQARRLAGDSHHRINTTVPTLGAMPTVSIKDDEKFCC